MRAATGLTVCPAQEQRHSVRHISNKHFSSISRVQGASLGSVL